MLFGELRLDAVFLRDINHLVPLHSFGVGKRALGVRNIIDDNSFYDYLKLFAAFVRIAGYAGLLVNIDELVALSHGLSNSVARKKNYEAILRIINDCFQGHAQGVVFLFAGTDECVEDPRRGLFSYEALATRLAPNRFAGHGHRDLSSPVIRLQNLTREECFVLLSNVRYVHAGGDQAQYLIPDAGIKSYLKQCSDCMGANCFQTPRDVVKDFVGLLNIREQDKSVSWKSLIDRPKDQRSETAPWSVNSLVQRLGRSGRKDGEPQVMRLLIEEDQLDAESELVDRVRPNLLRAVALTELMLEKWVEPPSIDEFDLSTLVQQILSVLAETGGAKAQAVFESLIPDGAFRALDHRIFAGVFRSLGEKDVVEQVAPALTHVEIKVRASERQATPRQ